MRIVVSYRGIPGRQGWACGDSVARALVALGHEVYRYGNVYQSSERIDPNPMPWTPDLLLWMECNDADPQYAELLRLPCKKVMWDFDSDLHPEMSEDLSSRFDRCFWGNLKWARKRREMYLPYAFDDELMHSTATKTNRIAVVGTPFPERVEFANKIGVEVISGVYGQDYVDTVASLLCHVHHYNSGGEGLLVNRIWETMGLGTCLLTDDNSDVLYETFPNPSAGEIFLTYFDNGDARQKVRLTRDEWGKDVPLWVGQRSREFILSNHTYRHRVEQLLDAL